VVTAGEPTPTGDPYTAAFYEDQMAGSRRSAEVVAPWLIDLVRPASVLDVGCGAGTWLRAFVDRGVTDVVGVDGDHVARSLLQIDPGAFRPIDLSRPFDLGCRFDLVLSLEVAEHLEAADAGTLVDSIIHHGDVVAFSAAVPFQGGTHHLNEQWPGYWIDRFAGRGYACLDVARPWLWEHPDIEPWYAQNLFLFVAEGELARDRWAAARDLPTLGRIAAIHPRLHEMWNAVPSPEPAPPDPAVPDPAVPEPAAPDPAPPEPAPPEPAVPDVGSRAHLAAARGHLRELVWLSAALPGSVARALRRRRAARGG
jgi:SAM-dependent methyltransferase